MKTVRRFIENITYCEAHGVYRCSKAFLLWREIEDKIYHYVSYRVFFLCEATKDAGSRWSICFFLQTCANRLPKTTVSRNLPPKSLLHWNPSVKTLEWLSKRKVSTLPPRKVYNMRAASPSQINKPLMLTPLHWHHPFSSRHRRPKAISFY